MPKSIIWLIIKIIFLLCGKVKIPKFVSWKGYPMLSEGKKTVNLNLIIDTGKDSDWDEINHQTRMLFREIQDLDVESIEFTSGEAVPIGTKSVDTITIGMLAVAVLPTVIPELIKFLQAWSLRGENRTVKIKTQIGDRSIEVEYDTKTISETEIKNLINSLNQTLSYEADDKNT